MSTSPLTADDRMRRATESATSTTGLRHRVEMLFPLPFLAFPHHAVPAVSDPHVPHVKVATYRQVVRETYLRPVVDGYPAVRGPPVHDRGALGATRVNVPSLRVQR
jgi:hypothetical protein